MNIYMEPLNILKFFGLCVLAYLLASIPWGLILTRKFSSLDIRQEGSGNIGAANVQRIAGLRLGMATLAGDMLKGFFPVWLAGVMTSSNDFRSEIFISLVALCALAGHLYPVYLRFKNGGKGVATAAGCFLAVSPLACFIDIIIFSIVICLSNHVSVGSLAAAVALPLLVWMFTQSTVIMGWGVVTAIFIFARHTDNIKRLLSGTEAGIWGKKGK